jgi:hypothetical protein
MQLSNGAGCAIMFGIVNDVLEGNFSVVEVPMLAQTGKFGRLK